MTHARNDGNTVDKDEARTPPSLFEKLDKRFNFQLDAFASPTNTLCNSFFSITPPAPGIGRIPLAMDALSQDWKHHLRFYGGSSPSVFGNPPYSNPEPFIIKAYEESQKGLTCVLLIPADTSTKVFHYYTMLAAEIIFIEGRVKHLHPDGTPMKNSPKFGSMVVVFKQDDFDGSPVISSMRWK